MRQSKVLETWVGLFVALGLLGLFFLAMKVSNLADFQTRSDSYRLTARFQNVGSLRPRAPVSMGGVRVGRVKAIRIDKETYEAVVEMRIDPEYDTIPSDTTANILTAGLLGEQYIGLSPGGAGEFLKDGGEIELSQSAMVLEEVISRFLFNKAESGSEKSEPAASADTPPAEADAPPDEAAPVAQPKPAAKKPPTPVAKPGADKGEAEAGLKKPVPGKGIEGAKAPKAVGKGGDGTPKAAR